MESGCFAVILFGVAIAALVVAINSSSAATAMRSELRQMQARFDALEREMRRRTRREDDAGRDMPAPPPEPVPVPEPFTVAPEPFVVPEPAAVIPEPVVAPPQPLFVTEPAPVEPLLPPPPPPPPPPAPTPAPPSRPFDWESLVGVKLFGWIAGIALVLAAVFFLKYSVDHGWLSPIVRATLGLLTGTVLLVVCEMRVARNYALTANALHGAGIAILYATLFAIHALWQLLPAAVVFALMLVVTAVAVMLSIRRDSVFIALLGLMGGFATPALLSTTHRPIELFSYLLLLNGGLAWVAYRKRWVVLTAGSLIFTVIYQWVWIAKFLTVSQLPLAAAVFAVFALVGSAVLWMRGGARDDDQRKFERVALVAAILPMTFALFGAAVPAYGARYNTLFGFLLFMALGLAVIAKRRGPVWLHALGGAGVLLTFALWIALSYSPNAWPEILRWVAAFVVLYLAGGVFLDSKADRTAGLLLFVFPVLAAREPAAADVPLFFGSLFVILAIITAFAIRYRSGAVYLIASFLAIVTQAIWSAKHLAPDRLLSALLVYAAFGLLFLAAPVIARRVGRPIEPAWGIPATVLLSLAVLFFLTGDGLPPATLWGLALLLSILTIGLFGEAGRAGSPAFAVAGVILGWLVVASWWGSATLTVSTVPALFLVALFAIVILAVSARAGSPADDGSFSGITHLALTGHLFLIVIAPQPELSIPPWPLFAVLAVLDLALGTAALYLRRGTLMIGAGVGSQVFAIAWAAKARFAPWPNVALALTLMMGAFVVLWYVLARRQLEEDESNSFGRAAVFTLFLGHVAAIVAGQASASPLFATLLISHLALAVAVLVIAWVNEEYWLATALVPVLAFATGLNRAPEPGRELAFAGAVYALFIVFPLLLGDRARRAHHPYLAAVLASAPFFFFARSAIVDAGHGGIIGILPVAQAVLLLVLVWRLVRMEVPSERLLGRLALVAGAALAFITVAIPLQLDRQWITIGWALEAAALLWLFQRVPHRGLLLWAAVLFGAVFVRLVLNPSIFISYPRATTPIFNWYLYTYGVSAAAFFAGARLLSPQFRRAIALLASGGTILLFFLLNIEIADYYTTSSQVAFRLLSATLAQDLTYTMGWAIFALALLVIGIWRQTRGARIAALSLLVVTILKCFLHDLGRLGGLYRVGSLLGLAISLVLVGLLLQKFVLRRSIEDAT